MENNEDLIRLNKYISESGYCSRREADRLIESGEVKVDQNTAVTGMKISKKQKVTIKGKQIGAKKVKPILIAVNKPKGIICTSQPKEKPNIVEFLNFPERIYPVGRLDKDSEGLILMTNMGDIVNKIMRAGNRHEKEYIVTVNKKIDDKFIKKMSSGVPILDTVTRKCRVEKIADKKFRIILTQGLNRQIRRMCEYLGYEVITLKRIRIMNIELGILKTGEYRELTSREFKELNKMTEGSRN